MRTLCLILALLALALPAGAATSTDPQALARLLTSHEAATIIPAPRQGFSLSSTFESGRASGFSSMTDAGATGLGLLSGNMPDRLAELEGDQRVHAFLLDGRYSFTKLPVQPYVSGGLGMAMYDQPGTVRRYAETGAMVPLLRLGGGVVYQMGEDWDLSLNYRAGFTGHADSAPLFSRTENASTVDMQMLDMGLKFKF
ncbi:MAG: hypothetical protein EBZ69_04820 [Alphaproteobacteria bacterium]|nr:hypothetical protein [Alphaproteobacteria bacterium]NDC56119.1 hypothetical protein [Alphaproteobacteria bacterium]NDG04251.1 hypothetical protein [Alphaproteobacteria bacterium]